MVELAGRVEVALAQWWNRNSQKGKGGEGGKGGGGRRQTSGWMTRAHGNWQKSKKKWLNKKNVQFHHRGLRLPNTQSILTEQKKQSGRWGGVGVGWGGGEPPVGRLAETDF